MSDWRDEDGAVVRAGDDSPQSVQRRRGVAMVVIGWALAFVVVAAFFHGVVEDRRNPNRLSVLDSQNGELVLRKNVDGHYYAEGRLNGEAVVFLLDTGATQIAVPGALADKIGLDRRRRGAVRTAGGIVDAYPTVIEELQVGPLLFYDLRGVIVPDMDSSAVLLGMNALGRLQITQQDGELILRPDDS